ncbi:uncharacterized protein [Littorina saxatilis]|uniref:Right handed beta helix domain-containing protein n=1 Tax=Littorina saxatilis TaxID=31220 RepID=A0AAN9AHZ9_9CAEN
MLTIAWLCFLWSVTCVWSASVHIYVSPTGSDSNDGLSTNHPMETLNHVANLLSTGGIHGDPVFVELMQGHHDLSSTLHIQSTSGTVVFRAYQGQEVHVTGGKRLPSGQFHQVIDSGVLHKLPHAAHSKVVELDLTAAGVTDTGQLVTYGWFVPVPVAPLEIYINGNSLRLAEWPNRGFINIKSLPDGAKGKRFTYDAAGRDLSWANETEPWTYGFWWRSYGDFSVAVSHVDPHTHTVTQRDHPTLLAVGHYDPSNPYKSGGNQQGGYFRVINMLCELDQPGEYYIDRRNNKLYLWPNTPHQTLTSSDIVYASMINECITIENTAHNVHFEDFSLEACRHHGFQLNAARNITIKNLEIKNTGGNGVHCSGDCRSVSVLSSDIHDVNGGIFMGGGERTQLVSSQNVIRDNHIWQHARLAAFPNHAIFLQGVHTTVSHNHLHHGQYTGIWWEGNDHVIEYNHIHHMCINASDCGAIHSLRDWTFRGNVIRYNHVHDTRRLMPGASVRGIMLDDEYAAVLIENNVLYDNDIHANIGGGRDNVIRYNVMFKAREESVQVDGRGLGTGHGQLLRRKLQASPYRNDVWERRYPELYNILNGHPEAPEGNQIYSNIFYNTQGVESIHYSGNTLRMSDYFNVHDNHRTLKTSDFRSPSNADFRMRCETAQWASRTHFPQPVTLDEVGPTVPTGPHYLRVYKEKPRTHSSPSPPPCDNSTVAPATSTPGVSYLPDGTAPNHLYPDIPKEGCWLITEHCNDHPEAEGTHKDDLGTQNGTEEGCLARAAQQWTWCGATFRAKAFAVYGPTGATTLGAKGCYFAFYGCGHPEAGQIVHDSYSEHNENGTFDEDMCLGRAARQWRFCGSPADRPVTSIFGATGAKRTAGAGCWVKVRSCPAHRDLEGYFFDAWGATNRDTGTVEEECFDRARYYWTQCGSHSNAPVTAYFRPYATSHTDP